MTEPIQLPARLDATELSAFAPRLTEACTGGTVQIDAGEVTHMGALGVQLILAAARDQRSLGGTLEICAISERATSQLAMMGLSPQQLSEGAP
ncbi:STAS domain-containing protein [uncultured Tateyamaria sp.]|uniref:STAS domain-containing protein n=1 Tax=uncultured Tateyamaria sp. TaxID=455651 RepID=UPI002606553D|nr:STAS domain-containing protein [uncultured Tateyamaria sp.]